MTQKAGGKGSEIMRALFDFVVLVLLLTATGFGGYWWGLNQRLAPVQTVPPGTPGALPPLPGTSKPAQTATPGQTSSSTASPQTAASTTAATATDKPPAAKRKYWFSSSGDEYIGSSITVSINGTPVDMFYGPGKIVDITGKVKPGENTVVFESKLLGADYNKHTGEADARLNVQLNSGSQVQENVKASDILMSYKRSATDSENDTQTKHFTGE